VRRITLRALALLTVAALAYGPAPTHAESCTVVSVQDGDTLTADCPEGRLKVRLREIDAPERTQPYSRIATDNLKRLCLGKPATIADRALDKYGRTLARVTCGRTDANAAQVRQGFAWAFTKYLDDPAIAEHEANARLARRGLWRDPMPVAPWDSRRRENTR
jgi:micrococcal nuclease